MTSDVPADLRRPVEERANSLCEYCLIHESDTLLGCQVDHVLSEKHGGVTIEENLALACTFCNRAKGTDIGSVSGKGMYSRFFNPRLDRWHEHFRLDGVRIESISLAGEVTVKVLQFNTTQRLLERQALSLVCRYPSEDARRRMVLTGD